MSSLIFFPGVLSRTIFRPRILALGLNAFLSPKFQPLNRDSPKRLHSAPVLLSSEHSNSIAAPFPTSALCWATHTIMPKVHPALPGSRSPSDQAPPLTHHRTVRQWPQSEGLGVTAGLSLLSSAGSGQDPDLEFAKPIREECTACTVRLRGK